MQDNQNVWWRHVTRMQDSCTKTVTNCSNQWRKFRCLEVTVAKQNYFHEKKNKQNKLGESEGAVVTSSYLSRND